VESQEFLDFMQSSGFGIQVRVGDDFGDFMQEQFVGLEDIFELAGYNQQ